MDQHQITEQQHLFKRLRQLSRVDCDRFWNAGFSASGQAQVEDFSRVLDLHQIQVVQPVVWSVRFWTDDLTDRPITEEEKMVLQREKKRITVTVSTTVVGRCDRCLEPASLQVEASRDLILTDQEVLLDELDQLENYDAIFLSNPLDVTELIEDELLFSVPLSFLHAGCELLDNEEDEENSIHQPFSNLKNLLKN
jgi:uncharacterized metal-binding protein YceD (DUF177 family)